MNVLRKEMQMQRFTEAAVERYVFEYRLWLLSRKFEKGIPLSVLPDCSGIFKKDIEDIRDKADDEIRMQTLKSIYNSGKERVSISYEDAKVLQSAAIEILSSDECEDSVIQAINRLDVAINQTELERKTDDFFK